MNYKMKTLKKHWNTTILHLMNISKINLKELVKHTCCKKYPWNNFQNLNILIWCINASIMNRVLHRDVLEFKKTNCALRKLVY